MELKGFLFAVLICQCSGFEKFPKFDPLKISSLKVESRIIDDSNCDAQLKLFDEGLAKRDWWALQMFDTWAKFDSGYLVMRTYSYGHFKECVKFRHVTGSTGTIRGQHCLVTFGATDNSSLPLERGNFDWRELGGLARDLGAYITNGICLPASCSPAKVLEYTSKFLLEADLQPFAVTCQTDDTPSFEALDIIAIVVFSTLGILLISSTVYDVIMRYKQAEPHKLYISFSAYTNGRKLFDITENKSPNSINCLNGLRALSVFWIMFGHRIGNQTGFPIANMLDFFKFFSSYWSLVISAYTLAVDTFFLMGALLATMSIMQAVERGTLSIPRMIYHRYIRYTPVWAAVILYIVSISKFTVSGPMGSTVDLSSGCKKYWWASLLHIQNYIDAPNQCFNPGWYLSADFQLYIITPFLVYPAIKYGWKYLWSIPTLGLMSSIYVLVISLVNEIYYSARKAGDFEFIATWIYFPTHARIGPWMVGITLGYILYKQRNQRLQISKGVNAALWIASLSILLIVMLTLYPLRLIFDNESTLTQNAAYVAFHRLLWAIAIAWIIFACHHLKTGGIIKWFLELRQFQPICRMGLSIYLIHLLWQLYTMANLQQVIFITPIQMLQFFWSDIFVIMFVASLVYLTIENPILLIDNYFHKKREEKRKLESTKV